MSPALAWPLQRLELEPGFVFEQVFALAQFVSGCHDFRTDFPERSYSNPELCAIELRRLSLVNQLASPDEGEHEFEWAHRVLVRCVSLPLLGSLSTTQGQTSASTLSV